MVVETPFKLSIPIPPKNQTPLEKLRLGFYVFLRVIDPTRSLRARLCLCFGAVTLLLTIALLTVVIVFSRERLLADNGLSLAELATSTAEMVDRGMFERLREVTNMARLPSFTMNSTYADKRGVLEDVRESYTYYSWIGFCSPQGKVLVSTQGILEGVNVSARPVFQNGLLGPWAGDVHYALLLQSLLANSSTEPLRFLDFSAPVYDSANNLIGVICAHLNWVWARDIQASALDLDLSPKRGLEMFIFTGDSRMLLGNPTFQNDTDNVLNLPWLSSFYNSSREYRFTTVSEWPTTKNISKMHGEKLVVGMAKCQGYATYKALPWILVFTMTDERASSLVESLQDKIIACGAVFWVVFSIVGWCIADQIASPLMKSSHVAEKLLANETDFTSTTPHRHEVQIPWFLKDEVFTMCKSVDLLMSTIEELREVTSMLEHRVEERTVVLREEVKCRMEMQTSAEEARHAAEAAEAGKSRFLANMSHEIRTPMNGILGTIQLVLDTKLSTDQLDYILTMKHSADSLLSIINDILLFSKLEANQYHLHASTFRMEHLLEGVGGLLSSLVNSKQLELYFLIEQEQVPPLLLGDTDRLQQVLVNMIGNAVKFTSPTGEILVVCSKSCSTCYLRKIFGTNDDSTFVRGGGPHHCTQRTREEIEKDEAEGVVTLNLEVRDSGCGMSAKQMEQLFTPFYQADTSTTRAAGGTGLGLSICKQLMELFNGGIKVQSVESSGTAFCCTVKLRPTPPRSSLSLSHEFLPRISTRVLLQSSTIAPREPTNILVVSASHWFSCVVTSFFTTIGFSKHSLLEHSTAENLEEKLAQLPGGVKYNAVILYSSDADEVNQKARMVMSRIQDSPVIVVCPSLTTALRKQLTSQGIRLLNTPLSEAKLRRYLASLLFSSDMEEGDGRTPKSPKAGEIKLGILPTIVKPPRSAVKVLAVEDNLTNLKILQKYLEKIGAATTTARDGVEAVAAVKKAGIGHFDLILMDLHMPNMDGIQATSEIRQWEHSLNISESQRLTIIALTADVMPGINEKCTGAGMDGYLSKPIDYSLLSSVVRNARDDHDSPAGTP